MKKVFTFIGIAIIIVVVTLMTRYLSYRAEKSVIAQENEEFEKYKDKEVYGLEVATLINKAVDKNTKNEIKQDDKKEFIQNTQNSIEIEIYIKDNETSYKMETFYNGGTEKFAQYYGKEKFKCSKIEYHKSTGKISYILFEQV